MKTIIELENKLRNQKKSGRQRFIYLMRTNENMYKIGVSQNPKKRLKGVQTGCPTKVELVYQLITYKALVVERLIHEVFKDNRISGEWFLFNDDEIPISEIHKRAINNNFKYDKYNAKG